MIIKRHITDILQLLTVGILVSLSFFLIGNKNLQVDFNVVENVLEGRHQKEFTPLNNAARISFPKLCQTSIKKAIKVDKFSVLTFFFNQVVAGFNNRFLEDFQLQLYLGKLMFPSHYFW